MSGPVGWFVRVTTGEVVDQVYDTVVYIAGFATPEECIAAVRATREKLSEPCQVLESPITRGVGPQPNPGEVRLIPGAV
jgi:hypothetical protein